LSVTEKTKNENKLAEINILCL